MHKISCSNKVHPQDSSMTTTTMRLDGKFFADTTGTHGPHWNHLLSWYLESQKAEELKTLKNVPGLRFKRSGTGGGMFTDIAEFAKAFKKDQKENYSPVCDNDYQDVRLNRDISIDSLLDIFSKLGYITEVGTKTDKSFRMTFQKD